MEWEKRSAYVFIKTYPGKAENVYSMIKEWQNTIGVFMTTGPWDVIAWIDTKDIDEAYKWISKVRYWPEVERTSTNQTYYGYRNEREFWEMQAWAWVKIRSTDIYSTYEELKNYDWVAFTSSIPGDWDCVSMFYGENYTDIYNYVMEIKNKGYEIEYYAPLKAYWNVDYKQKWEEYENVTVQAHY